MFWFIWALILLIAAATPYFVPLWILFCSTSTFYLLFTEGDASRKRQREQERKHRLQRQAH